MVAGFEQYLDWRTAYEQGKLVPVAKAILNPAASTKAIRAWLLEKFVNHLDEPSAQALGLGSALIVNFQVMQEEGLITGYFVHPMLLEHEQIAKKEAELVREYGSTSPIVLGFQGAKAAERNACN